MLYSISKAKQLSKYVFDWYINRIIPHIEKMVAAKEGKIDVDYFKNMIQKREEIEQEEGLSGLGPKDVKYDYISGWFLDFFAYFSSGEKFVYETMKVDDFNDLANQMLVVPFKLTDVNQNEYELKYKVGFIGCAQNKKNEISPVQGWFVSPYSEEDDKNDNKNLYMF